MTLPEMEDDVDEAALKGIEEHMEDHLREAAEAHMGPLVAEVRRLMKVAAAERTLRLAINDMVRSLSDGGRLNAATARASEAATSLRALGIEP